LKTYQQILIEMREYRVGDTLGQLDQDTGDSAQRAGTFFALCSMSNLNADYVVGYDRCIDSHTARPGIYRRSPDPKFWGYNTNNFSRDQYQALQLAFAARRDSKRLQESMSALKSRKFFHQNTHPGTDAPPDFRKTPDFSHPSHFSVHIRGRKLTLFTPLLYVIDLFLLGDLVLRQFTDTANDVDNMIAPQLLFANLQMPTFVSKLAMKLYLRTNFMTKLRQYHGPARNGIIPMADLIQYAYTVNNYKPKEA